MTERQQSWLAWRDAQDRKRVIWAWSSSALLAVLVVGAVYLSGLLKVLDLGTPGDAISVKLGVADGEVQPLSVVPQSDPSMQALLNSATSVQQPETIEPADNQASVQPKVAAKPIESQKPIPSVRPTAEPKPASSAPQTVQKTKGSETGNTMETVFGTVGGKVGRSLYVPIYLFMPLPQTLDASIVERIGASKDSLRSEAQRRESVLTYYGDSGRAYRLKVQPALDVRPELWIILQESGYDLTKAEYKTAKKLSPITLSFELTAAENGVRPHLTSIKLETSSGDTAVDSAVLYGFQRSAFANGTGKTAQGRFTYDFSDGL